MEENVIQKINNIIESIKNGTDSIENYKNQLTTLKLKTGWTLAHELAAQNMFTGLTDNKSVLIAATRDGWTVAHEMAAQGYKFDERKDKNILLIKNNKNTTVAHVMVEKGAIFTDKEILSLYRWVSHEFTFLYEEMLKNFKPEDFQRMNEDKDYLKTVICKETGETAAHLLVKNRKIFLEFGKDDDILLLQNKNGEPVVSYIVKYFYRKIPIDLQYKKYLLTGKKGYDISNTALYSMLSEKMIEISDILKMPNRWLKYKGYCGKSFIQIFIEQIKTKAEQEEFFNALEDLYKNKKLNVKVKYYDKNATVLEIFINSLICESNLKLLQKWLKLNLFTKKYRRKIIFNAVVAETGEPLLIHRVHKLFLKLFTLNDILDIWFSFDAAYGLYLLKMLAFFKNEMLSIFLQNVFKNLLIDDNKNKTQEFFEEFEIFRKNLLQLQKYIKSDFGSFRIIIDKSFFEDIIIFLRKWGVNKIPIYKQKIQKAIKYLKNDIVQNLFE